ncbi:amidohydrolase family protein, partial [Bacillus sp. D-CC]
TEKPADTFGLEAGRLKEGRTADITIIDLEQEEEIDPTTFLSKGKNTPFAGWKCQGWPVMTIVGGKIAWQKESALRISNGTEERVPVGRLQINDIIL